SKALSPPSTTEVICPVPSPEFGICKVTVDELPAAVSGNCKVAPFGSAMMLFVRGSTYDSWSLEGAVEPDSEPAIERSPKSSRNDPLNEPTLSGWNEIPKRTPCPPGITT